MNNHSLKVTNNEIALDIHGIRKKHIKIVFLMEAKSKL